MAFRAKYMLVVALVLVAAVCARLGAWQLDRLRHRRESNQAAQAARQRPVVSLHHTAVGEKRDNRRVTASGRYDRAHEIILRGQVYRKTPGVYVVTPLRLQGSDSAVLVNRGFVPAPDALSANVDSLDEPGEVEVSGLALAVPTDKAGGSPLERHGRTTWRRLDLAAFRARLPFPLLDVYVLQLPASEEDASGFPRRLEPPQLNDGPHLNYAIQWFGFAVTAGVFAGVFLRKSVNSKR